MRPSVPKPARRLWRSCTALLIVAMMLAGSLATVGAQPLLVQLPSVTGVTPSVIVAGTLGAEVCLTGVNLGTVLDARVLVNGEERVTTSVSATQVCTQLTTADLADQGTLSLQARTVLGDSAPITLTVSAPVTTPGAPIVTGITPGTILAGTPGARVCLAGVNLGVTGLTTQVLVGTDLRAAASVTPEQVCVDLTAADLANPGTLSLGVSVGGVLSTPATLTINAPLPTTGPPTTGSPIPGIVVAGTPSVEICLPGAGFTADARVLVNGLPVVVTSVSPTQICFRLALGNAVPGTLQVVVQTGGGTSSPVPVTVVAPGTTIDATPPALRDLFLVGTGLTPPPTGRVTFLATLQDDVALGGLQASSNEAGPYRTVTSLSGTGPVRVGAAFDVTDPAFGGSSIPGARTVYLRAIDAQGNVSSLATLQVTYTGVTPRFSDVAVGSPGFEAITELAARGIILGFEPETCRLLGQSHPCFGPNQPTLRAQMAALITRANGWAGEANNYPFPDPGPVDPTLLRNIGTLNSKTYACGRPEPCRVAAGFPDGTYKPTLPVAQVQTISFITRSMVALGYWTLQPDDQNLYRNVPANSGHREDLATYVHYLGAVPGTTPTAEWPTFAQPASRAFFSEAQFKAVQWREDPANYGPIPRP